LPLEQALKVRPVQAEPYGFAQEDPAPSKDTPVQARAHRQPEPRQRQAKRHGSLDVLVNSAAFQQHVERLEDLRDEQLQETLQTNIAGYFHMARATLPDLALGDGFLH
jgi:NAD(P)-dependent dehydrogenase (short-subunit alcohol dehydrogenase family)